MEFIILLQMQNSHWQERAVGYRSAAFSDGMAWNGNPYDGEKFKADALPAYYGKGPEKVYVKEYSQWTEEEMEEMSFLEAEIKQHIDSEIPKFILGRRPLSEYDKFIEEINNMGYQKYLDIVQSGYDREVKD